MEHMDGMGIGTEMRQSVNMPLCERTVSCESTGDYILPDYQPEIRRLLYVSPTVLPAAKYIGGTGAEFNGTVDYQVMYVGADGEVYTAPLSSEYSFNVPLEQTGDFELNEGVTVFASTVSENVTARVSAPRKLTLRCRLRSQVRIYGKMLLEESCIGGAPEGSVQRLRPETENMWAVSGNSDVITVSEEIMGMGEETRVISAEANTFITDVQARDGMIRAGGDVLLRLAVCRDNDKAEMLQRKLPFEGEIETEGMGSDYPCRVKGTVSDISVHVEEGRIFCEVGVILEGRGMKNMPVSYTADLYSTEVESDCEYKEYKLPVVLKCENANVSQSERIPLEELNISEGTAILDTWGSMQLEGCETVGEKYLLSGQSKYVFLCEKGGEYSTAELNLPLRYETARGEGEPTSFDATVELISCRARIDGETLNLDAELSVVADFVGEKTIRALDTVRFGENIRPTENCMVVYYPSADDTAWTVAKKYHVAPERLSQASSYYFF